MKIKKSNKCTIQISKEVRDDLHEFCKLHGYKLSGFTEIAIRYAISGSLDLIKNKI